MTAMDQTNTTSPGQARHARFGPVRNPTLEPNRSSDNWWLLLVALVAGATCAPFLHTIYGLGDEGMLLRGAERILNGSRLYVDFWEFLPPGGFYLTAAWLSISGISLLSARLLAASAIVGIACFTFLASRQASRNAPLSALFTIGWLVLSQGVWTQLNHHWFTTMFSMVAAWASLASFESPHQRWRWPLLAGLAAGTASMVTPTRGALAMIAAATAFLNLRRQRAELIVYLLGGALVPLGLVAYLVWDNAFTAAYQDVIVWTGRRYAPIQYVPFGAFADLQNRPLRYLFPLGFLLTCFVFWRNGRSCLSDRPLMTCVVFGFAGFVGCFPRPDIVHIAFAAPLALPLLANCLVQVTRSWHAIARYVAVAILVVIGVPSLRSFSWTYQKALAATPIQTPRGAVAFIRQWDAKFVERIAAMPADDGYFFYPYMPMLPFLTARQHVSKYDIFVPGYTLGFEYQDACRSAVRHASWLVIDPRWMKPGWWKEVWPAIRDEAPPEKRRFERALESSFDLVERDETFELRHRREDAKDAFCNDIVRDSLAGG